MIEYDRFQWWRNTFAWRGTALPLAYRRVLVATCYCLLLTCLYRVGIAERWLSAKTLQGLDPFAHGVLGSLIGFLIVFRLNASNARYWEGRSLWGGLINTSRNLVRAGAAWTTDGATLADLVAGYAVALRCSLRGERDLVEAAYYLPAKVVQQAARFGNPPSAVAAAMSEWIVERRHVDRLEPQQVRHLEQLVAALVDCQGGCEKIQKTPLPFAYASLIKQLILTYLVTLPLVLVPRTDWWGPLLMGVVSLGMLGMEEVSVEVEDPFGTHPNCLDLETLTMTIARDVGQLTESIDADRDPSGPAGGPTRFSGTVDSRRR